MGAGRDTVLRTGFGVREIKVALLIEEGGVCADSSANRFDVEKEDFVDG